MMRLVVVAGNSCLTIRSLIVLLTICWLVEVRSLSTKTKTKVITLANRKEHRQYSEPIKTRSNYR